MSDEVQGHHCLGIAGLKYWRGGFSNWFQELLPISDGASGGDIPSFVAPTDFNKMGIATNMAGPYLRHNFSFHASFMNYDLIVIGGGPAGYVAAIRAAQLGKKAACVEMDRAGGTCLNWGCIPTKSLLRNAEIYHLLKHKAGDFGLSFDNLTFDWSKVIGRSRKISDRLAAGIEFLFKKNKVESIRGRAKLLGGGKVEVLGPEGTVRELAGEKILVATGCSSRPLPGLPFDGATVISSHEALILPKQPKDIVIIGAGAIGVEFAYFFNSFGTKVTLVEMQAHILPGEDQEISETLEKSFKRQGISVLTSAKITASEAGSGGVQLSVETPQGAQTLAAELCLVAIGVQPVLPGGIEFSLTDRGYLDVDDRYQTSQQDVFAAGDVIGPPWLAHVATWEALQAVEGLFAGHIPQKMGAVPGCTYCQPQVASVGLTERAAKAQGLNYKVGKFPFQALGKALAIGESEGFVKLIVGAEHGEILGAHILGNEATEMIAELGLAISLKAKLADIEATIHAHPTLAEAIKEAAEVAAGHAIHI